jgi:phosphoglycerate dehydrogenase-like enzyme
VRRVLIRGLRFDEAERASAIAAAGPELEVLFDEPVSLDGVVAIAGRATDEELETASDLRWVHLWSAGADGALTPALDARADVTLTASLGNGAVPLAEYAVLMMLLLSRGGWYWADAQREHRWDPRLRVELSGQTVGLVGLGRSGRHLAEVARALGMRVLATRRTPGDDDSVDAVYPPDRLAEMLAECDFVVVTAPLTPESRGMLGEAEFRAMKPTAFYINYSRGAVADEAALTSALVEGRIAGAALDAHHVEPLPADSILWDLPNVIVTPHNASTSTGSKARAIESFLANLPRFVRGGELADTVDRHAGY